MSSSTGLLPSRCADFGKGANRVNQEVQNSQQSIEQNIAGLLSSAFGGSAVRVSLTPMGAHLAARLGARWFLSAVGALKFTYPDSALELILQVCDLEPMTPPLPLMPALAGAMFSQGRALGRITVGGDGSEPAVCRSLQLPSDGVLDETADYNFLPPTTIKRRIIGSTYRRIFSAVPMLLDEWRQSRNGFQARSGPPMSVPESGLSSAGSDIVAAPDAPVAWFALHWLEAGGAESWALQAARLAADAGYRVVVTADVPAPQRMLDQFLAITDDVFLGANSLTEEDWEPFLVRLIAEYRPTIVHIHHSMRAYGFLPDLRHRLPAATVIDSTHIVEHRTGGFVRQSIGQSPNIDVHHVISPELRDLYAMDAGVDRAKIFYRPLVSERDVATDSAPCADTPHGGPLRVGFLGRLAPQKRPFLFVALVARLHRRHPGRFEFVMQGSGVLDAITTRQIRRRGLQDVIVRRSWGPVEQFMDDVDVLVISSDNEGLTLTSLEAERHGVLILSADVGSQRTVVAEPLLVPRPPRKFVAGAARALDVLATVPGAFLHAQREQHALVRALGQRETASSFLKTWLMEKKENI